MKYSEATQARAFIVRLEDGDILHEEIERLAQMESIAAAAVIAVGGIDRGSTLVVGPKKGRAEPVVPMEHVLDEVHEVAATGTIFPDESGKPVLHMHAAAGRRDKTITGCVRNGVKTWHILEVVVLELADTNAVRALDGRTGFALLNP
ncbi:MAG: DUF296 domain-containing protein [Chitinivibrionales bacterium]|nr:DUF296 domain-containing protein [Chitinivibrionales bacterium]MBD3396140.1 DUF296 domain-containing protein [Chitinivibrionales bacterium]